MKIKVLAYFVLILLLGSCSVPKDVTYFQGVDTLSPEQIEQLNQTYVSKICPDDMLTITVAGWDPTVLTPFNPPPYSYLRESKENASNTTLLQTYLVFKDGTINFPVLGKINAAGLSRQELTTELEGKIAKYAKDVMVNVQIVNYKVTMVGEVHRPGALSVKNDRISILDAIGLAGDLSINANRKNILIIRDNNGKKEFGRIDLTGTSFFSSPYFYLQQNDVVYVEPNNAKKKNSKYSQAEQYSITVASTLLSAVSVITTVILAISKK